jgi:hypothetical protein
LKALVDSSSSLNLSNKGLLERIKVRNGNKRMIVKMLYRPTNEEIGSIEEIKERITTETVIGTYEVRFHTMGKLKYKAILGYKFFKETNAKIN